MRKSASIALVISSALILASCSGVEDSSEYKELKSQVDQTKDSIKETQDAIDAIDAKMTTAKASRESARQERNDKRDAVSTQLLEPGVIAKVIKTYVRPGCVKWHTEVMRQVLSTDDAQEKVDAAWESLSASENYWFGAASVSDPDGLEGFLELQKAFKAVSEACEEAGEDAFYATCVKFDRLQLKKDPSRYKGKCLTGTVRIAQMDSNTGPCAFQGYVGGGYDVRAQFGQVLTTSTMQISFDCDWMDDLREDKTITFWAVGLGSYSYSTTLGGTQTVPAFKMFAWS